MPLLDADDSDTRPAARRGPLSPPQGQVVLNADMKGLGTDRGHRVLCVCRKGGKL
jgi:hypothetical protein